MQCKFCGKECKNIKSIRTHEKLCKLNPNRIILKENSHKYCWVCDGCGEKCISKHSLEKHKKLCSLYKEYKFKNLTKRESFICPYCNKEILTTLRGLSNHKNLCHLNPDKSKSFRPCNLPKPPNKEGGWKCCYCLEIFKTRKELDLHKHSEHSTHIKHAWNKGLTKDTSDIVKQYVNTRHIHFIDGVIKSHQLGKPLNESHKLAISNSMKIAHKEGRAHNIGNCRWNNEHSYPEKWFIKVLRNEFGMLENIDYKTEFSFHKYSLDFAWPDKCICIEIDGEQHQRFREQSLRDIEKDNLLKQEGWVEIRKSWKEIYNNPKLFIEEVRTILFPPPLFILA